MGITELVSSLADNPYFGAGFGLFGLGAGTAVLRKGYMVSVCYLSYYVCMQGWKKPKVKKTCFWMLNWVLFVLLSFYFQAMFFAFVQLIY